MEAAGAIRTTLPAQLRARSFERECERLRPLGVAYVLRRFGGSLNRADAEDAVADVLIRLHRQTAAGHIPQNLRAAFFTSVRNAAIDQLRSRRGEADGGAGGGGGGAGLQPVSRRAGREPRGRGAPAGGAGADARQLSRGDRPALRPRPHGARDRPAPGDQPAGGEEAAAAGDPAGAQAPGGDRRGGVLPRDARAGAPLAVREGGERSGQRSRGQVLHAHFEHCGSCKSFLASLHDSLHDLGSGALLAGVATDQLGAKIGIVDHLAHWLGQGAHGVQAGAAKLRFAAFKATGALQPGDAGTAGALAGTGQKIAAICTAGAATTATCLATGIVGPGPGASPPPVEGASAARRSGQAGLRALRSVPARTGAIPAPRLRRRLSLLPNPRPSRRRRALRANRPHRRQRRRRRFRAANRPRRRASSGWRAARRRARAPAKSLRHLLRRATRARVEVNSAAAAQPNRLLATNPALVLESAFTVEQVFGEPRCG